MNKDNSIKLREYQEKILNTAKHYNTLVILPTGMGKTIIAFFLIIERLKEFPDQKIFFLAPTKPLITQHYNNFIRLFPEYKDISVVITGEQRPERREYLYKASQIIFITPQTLYNDLVNGKISFYNASTLVVDEAHRAVKKYAYVLIAKKFLEQSKNPRVLGLTASPGFSIERIKEIIKNLGIEVIEIRTGREPDIRPYMKKIYIEKIDIELTPEIKYIKELLDKAKSIREKKLEELLKIKIEKGKKWLLDLQSDLQKRLKLNPRDYIALQALSIVAELIKIEHALELLETQTLYTFVEYLEELKKRSEFSKSRALNNFLEDIRIKKAEEIAKKLIIEGKEHPKIYKLIEIIEKNKDKKILIFAQIRKTVDRIYKLLKSRGYKVEKFLGKAEMKQADQIRILNKFRDGEFNILVSTSVGEEGIDIPKVDIVIFYEPIPSEIRYIQRRGRTGRTDIGFVYVLSTKKTRDEVFFWVAVQKERKMLRFVKKLRKLLKGTYIREDFEEASNTYSTNVEEKKSGPIIKYLTESSQKDKQEIEEKQINKEINDYTKKTVPVIIADYREKDSGLIQTLISMGVLVKLSNLEVGDYIVGDFIIERKTVIDFIKSIIDGRLEKQLEKLRGKKAIIIIEGEDLLESGMLNPNYIRSIILKILLTDNIPIIFTKDFVDTANYLYLLSKNAMNISIPKITKKETDIEKIKLNILKQIPGIGDSTARKLIEKFGSIENIIKSSKVELSNVVGESKAEKIKKILTE